MLPSQVPNHRFALLPSALFMKRLLRCQLGVLNLDRVLPSRTRTDTLFPEGRPSPTPQSPELGDFVLIHLSCYFLGSSGKSVG
jgi:hypothetical protein